MANEQNLTPMSKGQTLNPAGRPRKFVSTLTAEGYTKAQVTATYAALLAMSEAELRDVYQDKTATMLERTVANAIRKDYEKGALGNIDSVLGRAYGAPKQEVDTKLELTNKPAWLGQVAKAAGLLSGDES